MLNNLKILNGSITPVFDSSIKDYEVEVSDTVISLVMEYDTDENNSITIYGNHNLSIGENHVLVEVYDGTNVNTYTLTVYKGISSTINEQSTYEKIEVSEKVYAKAPTMPAASMPMPCDIVNSDSVVSPNLP